MAKKRGTEEFSTAGPALQWAARSNVNGMEFCLLTRNAVQEIVALAVAAGAAGIDAPPAAARREVTAAVLARKLS